MYFLYLSVFIATLGLALSMYFVPIYVKELGGGYLEVGLAGVARSAPYAITPFLLVGIVRKLGLARAYVLGPIFGAIPLLALPLVFDPYYVVALMVLSGIGMAFLWPPSEAMVAYMAKDNVSREIGAFSFSWGSAFFIGPYVGGLLGSYDIRLLFFVSGLLMLLGLVPFAKVEVKEGTIERDRKSLWAFIMVVPYSIMLGLLVSIYPAYATSLGFSPEWVGLLFAAFGLLRLGGFYLVRGIKMKRVALTMTIATMTAFALVITINHDGMAHLVLFSIVGLSMGIFFPLSLEYVIRKARSRIGSVGMYEGLFGVGFILGPAMGGFLASYDEGLPYIVSGLLMTVSLIPVFYEKGEA